MRIILILSYFYTIVFNSYTLSQLSFNMALFKLYIIYYISLKWNFEDKISENKLKNKMSRNVKIKLIDYKRNWVKKVDSKK